jgi:glycosyltransferase involved in cell wall biosynthesis
MDLPLVSVAMPVYNAENYIRKAIDSVLSQTYGNLELIIVNDASADRSEEIILSYKDPRIRYEANSVNLGIAKTRNKCVQLAKGKYIAVLDNDDVAQPERLELQMKFLESNMDFGVCGSCYEVIDENEKLIEKVRVPISDKEVKTYLLFDNCFCNSTIMIRSELLKERNYAEEFDMIEDYYFLYAISKFKKLYNLPLYITKYRVHGKNTSVQKLAGMRILHAKMGRMILGDLQMAFSEEEFDLHTNFVNGNLENFNSLKKQSDLEKWLVKLFCHLESIGVYDMEIVKKIFIRRWIWIFRRTGSVSSKVIFNKLFRKFHFRYISIFFRMVIEKYALVRYKA